MKKRVGIIGGGIIGTAIAYHLNLLDNVEAYVLEKNQISSGTTAKSAGTVCRLDDSLPEEYFDLRVLAPRSYMDMEKGDDCIFFSRDLGVNGPPPLGSIQTCERVVRVSDADPTGGP